MTNKGVLKHKSDENRQTDETKTSYQIVTLHWHAKTHGAQTEIRMPLNP